MRSYTKSMDWPRKTPSRRHGFAVVSLPRMSRLATVRGLYEARLWTSKSDDANDSATETLERFGKLADWLSKSTFGLMLRR